MKHNTVEYSISTDAPAKFVLAVYSAQDLARQAITSEQKQKLIDIAVSRLVDAEDELGKALCQTHIRQMFAQTEQHNGYVYVLKLNANNKSQLVGSAFALEQQEFALAEQERDNVNDQKYKDCNYAQKVQAWYNLVTPYLAAETTQTLALYTLTIDRSIGMLFNQTIMTFIRESIAKHVLDEGYLAMTIAAPKSSTFNGLVSDKAQTILPGEFVNYVVEATGGGDIVECAIKPLQAVIEPTLLNHSMFREQAKTEEDTVKEGILTFGNN